MTRGWSAVTHSVHQSSRLKMMRRIRAGAIMGHEASMAIQYWFEPVAPRPTAPGAALNLLSQSIEQGATVVAIGRLRISPCSR